jgi:hypothetical protein
MAWRAFLERLDVDAGGFDAAKTQAVIAQTHLHRIAHRCEADYFDFFVFQQAHFHEALDEAVLAFNAGDAAALAGSQLV